MRRAARWCSVVVVVLGLSAGSSLALYPIGVAALSAAGTGMTVEGGIATATLVGQVASAGLSYWTPVMLSGGVALGLIAGGLYAAHQAGTLGWLTGKLANTPVDPDNPNAGQITYDQTTGTLQSATMMYQMPSATDVDWTYLADGGASAEQSYFENSSAAYDWVNQRKQSYIDAGTCPSTSWSGLTITGYQDGFGYWKGYYRTNTACGVKLIGAYPNPNEPPPMVPGPPGPLDQNVLQQWLANRTGSDPGTVQLVGDEILRQLVQAYNDPSSPLRGSLVWPDIQLQIRDGFLADPGVQDWYSEISGLSPDQVQQMLESGGTVTVDMSGVEAALQGLQGEIVGLRGDLGGLVPEVQGLRGDVAGVTGELQGVRGDVQALLPELQGVRGDLQGVIGGLDGVQGAVEGVREGVDAVDRELEGLRQDVGTAVVPELQGIRAGVEALPAELQGVKGAVQGLGTEIQGVRGAVEGLGSDIQAVKGEVQALPQAIRVELEAAAEGASLPPPPVAEADPVVPEKRSLTAVLDWFWDQLQGLPILSALDGVEVTATGSPTMTWNLPLAGTVTIDFSWAETTLRWMGEVLLAVVTLGALLALFA